jgi:hypothetical protein
VFDLQRRSRSRNGDFVGMASNALGRLYARCLDMPYFFEHV